MNHPKSFFTSSRGILNQSDLSYFLQAQVNLLNTKKRITDCDAIIGWGIKPNTQKAFDYAKQNNLPIYRLEDAFLGYFGHPSKRHIRVGLIKDSKGIYYDANRSSDLDDYLQTPLSENEITQARNDLELFQSLQLSKYNDPSIDIGQKIYDEDFVLLIDQTYGDQSIKSGGASQSCFLWMLLDALNLYPRSKIVIRTHPDVKAGKKTGCFDKTWLSKLNKDNRDRVILNDDPINAIDLIKSAEAVFCVTSQMGFESIIHNTKVFTYSSAFYTCLGLSEDRLSFLSSLSQQEQVDYFKLISQDKFDLSLNTLSDLIETHGKKRTQRQSKYWSNLNQDNKQLALFHCAMVRYATYVHPDTKEICSLNEVLNWFDTQSKFKIKTKHPIVMHGFSLWKKWFIPAYLPFKSRHNLIFTTTQRQLIDQLEKGSDTIIVWGAVRAQGVSKLVSKQKIICVEDGFIRSQGLGVDLKRPSSLCFDDLSIYYNSQTSSRLNEMFLKSKLDNINVTQSRYLIEQIKKNGLSKYNVGQPLGSEIEENIEEARNKQQEIILVPGQVMGDASLKYGTSEINSNIKLIEQTKKDYPNAFLIYKPHPDVYASKKGDLSELALAQSLCDLVLEQENIALLYPHINRLCTMTSLSGFEALMRGIKVDCYGQPFYSGWGLTKDALRQRQNLLTLEQLVYVTLVEYPLYVNWNTWTFMQPDTLVKQLSISHVKVKPTGFLSKMLKKLGYLSELYKMSRSQY